MSEINLFFSDEFKQRLRTLAKRYRNIRKDLQPLINELHSGNFIGDKIVGTGYQLNKLKILSAILKHCRVGKTRNISTYHKSLNFAHQATSNITWWANTKHILTNYLTLKICPPYVLRLRKGKN